MIDIASTAQEASKDARADFYWAKMWYGRLPWPFCVPFHRLMKRAQHSFELASLLRDVERARKVCRMCRANVHINYMMGPYKLNGRYVDSL